eukprot:gnl/MRDRNA2_/MRDRNA2_115046_c0_seq1.p1 gnl/MRDRNA2_/MRDRNA2_115046_c0~~gnl/MRDRNA2_/MRDRNA2_115046_c0_seq1.p1  ORF type:complete len:530 (+),score=113.82 gnl/MRDRNA2_/MRDRNA2_115046_c0_seq1:81-1670(+)
MGCGASSKKYGTVSVGEEQRPLIPKKTVVSNFTVVEAPDLPRKTISVRNLRVTNAERIDTAYDIDKKKIGVGGHGSVRQATEMSTGFVRAVKSISKKSLKKDSNKFAEEVEIMRLMDHPNIIKLYETFEDAKFYYMVMELCEGGELFDKIIAADTGFSEVLASKVVRQIARAVKYMHSLHIAHRDLKPENFLLSEQKHLSVATLKAIDFGISKQFKSGVPIKSTTCTASYAAPEVLTGSSNELCDIWTLGVVTYLLVSGVMPWQGSESQIITQIRSGDFHFNHEPFRYISEDCKDLIRKCIVIDPDERFTADQVLQHCWLEKSAPNAQETLPNEFFDNLRGFRATHNLKKAALMVLAQQLKSDAISNLKDLFCSLDADNDGSITSEELRDGLTKLNVEFPADFKQILEDVVESSSGVIDYTAFVGATLDKKQTVQEDACWAAFRVFDLDGNGRITREELAGLLSDGYGENINDAFGVERNEIERIMAEVDKDKDGTIDFEEFIGMMRMQDMPQAAPQEFKKKEEPDLST